MRPNLSRSLIFLNAFFLFCSSSVDRIVGRPKIARNDQRRGNTRSRRLLIAADSSPVGGGGEGTDLRRSYDDPGTDGHERQRFPRVPV